MLPLRLRPNYIGCEHLLRPQGAAAGKPASARSCVDQGVTPAGPRRGGNQAHVRRGQTADPLGGLDRQALAIIGIDVNVVRARIERGVPGLLPAPSRPPAGADGQPGGRGRWPS